MSPEASHEGPHERHEEDSEEGRYAQSQAERTHARVQMLDEEDREEPPRDVVPRDEKEDQHTD